MIWLPPLEGARCESIDFLYIKRAGVLQGVDCQNYSSGFFGVDYVAC